MLATLKQGNQVFNLILQQGIEAHSLQKLIESGLLSDLLQADAETLDRTEFRELLGLEPADENRRHHYASDPFERYPWLRRRGFCLTAIDLAVDDRVRDERVHISRTATKKLILDILCADSSQRLKHSARELNDVHNVYECLVLDRRGRTIGSLSKASEMDTTDDLKWDFRFEDARFLAFQGADGGWVLVIYEIAHI